MMNLKARCTVALALTAGASLSCTQVSLAASSKEAKVAAAMMSSYEAELRAEEAARKKDPAWKPACDEVGRIQIGDSKKPGALRNFCLTANGNLLACFVPHDTGKSPALKKGGAILVYSPAGALLKTLPVQIKPLAICVAKDEAIFVAGDGQLLKLDATGKVLASVASPVANAPVTVGKELEEMLKQSAKQSKRSLKAETDRMKASLEQRRTDVTGLAVTEQDVFMAVPSPNDFSYRVYRFDHALGNPKLVVENLRGCCGQMDIQAGDGKLWVPHNARHSVEARDRDGKELAKFGKAGRVKASDFGGCCEPKNIRVLSNGEILAAESGPPTCIKRFSASGKFLGVVAVVKSKGDCVRVTVEASPDGKRFYLLDTAQDAIRIFGAKG